MTSSVFQSQASCSFPRSRPIDLPLTFLDDEVEDDRLISRERRAREAKVREIVRMLSDRDLAVALTQMAVLLEEK